MWLSPVWMLWATGAVALFGLGLYAASVGSSGWEVAIVRGVQGLDVPGLHQADLVLTRAGHTPLAMPLTVVAIAVLVAVGHPRLGLFLAVATAGRIVGGLIKIAVDRPRPDAADVDLAHIFGGPSFPSGHVLGTTLLLGWLAYSATHAIPHRPSRLAFQAACGLGMFMMGVSRIELGAHWPTDVAAGYLVAGLMLLPLAALNAHLHARSARA
jgi:undecaprenyl-diphosphatase